MLTHFKFNKMKQKEMKIGEGDKGFNEFCRSKIWIRKQKKKGGKPEMNRLNIELLQVQTTKNKNDIRILMKKRNIEREGK